MHQIISIHAPREGGDCSSPASVPRHSDFNPRPPRGGRLQRVTRSISAAQISIHAPREGGDPDGWTDIGDWVISIHAPREGGDRHRWSLQRRGTISIHAPREGGDVAAPAAEHKQEKFQSTPPARGATLVLGLLYLVEIISIHAPREGGDSKDVQFYLRIFDKQVELLRFLGKIRGGCLRNPEKDRRFLGKSLANLPEISGHLDFAGGGKARPGYPCAVPLPRRAACVRGSGDPPADRCSSYRNAPLFSHIASLDSKSADCLSQNP